MKSNEQDDAQRVVVTGYGAVSCLGSCVDKMYQSLLDGQSGIRQIASFDASSFPVSIAGEVSNFSTEGYIEPKVARRVDPFISYATVAAKNALEMAQIPKNSDFASSTGVIIGSGMGGMSSFYNGVHTVKDKGHKRLTPFFVPYIITNMAGSLISMEYGFTAPTYSVSTACATGNYALHNGRQHILAGEADIMVCGGSEAAVNVMGLSGFLACKALSHTKNPVEASRPWDASRNGFVMAEGAGVIILERLSHAKKRKARILCELVGSAINNDAYHITNPRSDGRVMGNCIKQALKSGHVEKEDVSFINAHATSTIIGDACEANALYSVFKDDLKYIPITSIKSMMGHSLGAASAIEAISAIKSIETSTVPLTKNIDNKDMSLPEMRIAKESMDIPVKIAISTSLGFGGHNSAVVLKKFSD